MAGEMTRRGFLKVGGGILVGSLVHSCGDGSSSGGGGSDPVLMTGRVIHVHSPQATSWDFGQDYYGRFVDQAVVDAMVDDGIKELTGKRTLKLAWRRLIPDYEPGKAIAIKVNFNNNVTGCTGCETGCNDNELQSDGLMEPVNAVIRGLVGIGVEEQDIWIYDASRRIASRFTSRCLYPGVRYFDRSCNEPAEFVSVDPDAGVTFTPPAPIPMPAAQEITDVVVNASYLINMPIMKRHGGAGVTLGFKNHFGTITRCSDMHDYVFPWGAEYTDQYNPLVDINSNPHIRDKTVLVLGDGLFANRASQSGKPAPWVTFGDGPPNSLFFAADPVAVDCVMCDLLAAETTLDPISDDYLVLAGAAGLGTFERGDPWLQPYGSGYNDILYIRRDM